MISCNWKSIDCECKNHQQLEHNRGVVVKGTAGFTYAQFRPHSPEAVAQSKEATVQMVARQHLSQKSSKKYLNLIECTKTFTIIIYRFDIPADRIDVRDWNNGGGANNNVQVTCKANAADVRSADGTCNNLSFKRFGQAGTIFQRILPPVYQDGNIIVNSTVSCVIYFKCIFLFGAIILKEFPFQERLHRLAQCL